MQQDEYEGLIDVTGAPKAECDGDGGPTMYNFGITSLVNKKEPLQIGDKVTDHSVTNFTGFPSCFSPFLHTALSLYGNFALFGTISNSH